MRVRCVGALYSAGRMLSGMILLGTIVAAQDMNATGVTSQFNVQAQTACEAEMVAQLGAHEVFSGKAYEMLADVARAYGRAIPHIYISPGSLNMAYIAGSSAVDGRGKILVGQKAIELFDTIAFKGFLGHEMAHLVSDNAAQGCNDYILRNPQMEADADALAARTLGKRPVQAFLERVLALTAGQNWDAKRRLDLLQSLQFTKDQRQDAQAQLSSARAGIEDAITIVAVIANYREHIALSGS